MNLETFINKYNYYIRILTWWLWRAHGSRLEASWSNLLNILSLDSTVSKHIQFIICYDFFIHLHDELPLVDDVVVIVVDGIVVVVVVVNSTCVVSGCWTVVAMSSSETPLVEVSSSGDATVTVSSSTTFSVSVDISSLAATVGTKFVVGRNWFTVVERGGRGVSWKCLTVVELDSVDGFSDDSLSFKTVGKNLNIKTWSWFMSP